ncbi:MAG: hypothetical protein ACW968_05230 [Candidatus Thorarchaeota archaeon]|jgi:rubrerythrin
MTQSDQKLIDILSKQIDVEKRALDKLIKAEEEAEETAVRLVFMEMRLDTWKHVKFLEGMVEMLNVTPCDEWAAKVNRYVGRVKLERTLHSIMKEEDEMIDLLNASIDEVQDPIAKFLLEHLKRDEKGHNEALEKVIRIIQQAPLQSKKGEKGTDIVCN